MQLTSANNSIKMIEMIIINHIAYHIYKPINTIVMVYNAVGNMDEDTEHQTILPQDPMLKSIAIHGSKSARNRPRRKNAMCVEKLIIRPKTVLISNQKILRLGVFQSS